MTDRTWTYPAELADALLTFGLAPTVHTSPLLVRDALNDLYRFEIRRLKQRLLDGHVAKADYTPEVVLLRKKYWPLSLQPAHWEQICATDYSQVPSEARPSGSAGSTGDN